MSRWSSLFYPTNRLAFDLDPLHVIHPGGAIAVDTVGAFVAEHGQAEHNKGQQVDNEQDGISQQPVYRKGNDDKDSAYGQKQFIRAVRFITRFEYLGQTPYEHAFAAALTVMVVGAFGAEEAVIEQDEAQSCNAEINHQQTGRSFKQGIPGKDAGDQEEHGPIDKIGEFVGGFHSATCWHNIILSWPHLRATA